MNPPKEAKTEIKNEIEVSQDNPKETDVIPENAKNIELQNQINDQSTSKKTKLESRVSGTVKWFNAKVGYGFINRDDTNEDVFVHFSSIGNKNMRTGTKSLCNGEKVEFNLMATSVTGPNGCPVKGYKGNNGTASNRGNQVRNRNSNSGNYDSKNSGYQRNDYNGGGSDYTSSSDHTSQYYGNRRYHPQNQVAEHSAPRQNHFSFGQPRYYQPRQYEYQYYNTY